MKHLVLAILALCCLSSIGGCYNSGMKTLVAPPVARTLASNDGQYTFYWVPRPDPIPLNRFFAMDVQVMDIAGNLITPEQASLTVDAGMPQHGHGMNHVPRIMTTKDGWTAEGLLMHMPGDWQIYFDLEIDGVSHRGQTPMNVD